jgi:sec-independent protein translocase protein TatA
MTKDNNLQPNNFMLSISHLIVVLVIILVLFGAGKLPNVMGDIGKGIKNFRKSIKDENEETKKIDDQNQDKKL